MKKWKVKLIFREQEVLLPGEWNTPEEAEWEVARWKEKVRLYTDPFVYFKEGKEKE